MTHLSYVQKSLATLKSKTGHMFCLKVLPFSQPQFVLCVFVKKENSSSYAHPHDFLLGGFGSVGATVIVCTLFEGESSSFGLSRICFCETILYISEKRKKDRNELSYHPMHRGVTQSHNCAWCEFFN